ncbi:S1 family peptidase [Rhodococcus sp. X156]|uniref:S1 family peptidase n=1 Tax=Rhodococcus sp. X156 TaxID=2499145 RepID=UPI000FD8DE6A|nr:S1 family peptidase [Rhodococcus sp. X156]
MRSSVPSRKRTFHAVRATLVGLALVASGLVAITTAGASELTVEPVPSGVAAPVASVTVPAAEGPVVVAPAGLPVVAGEQYVVENDEVCSTGFAVTARSGAEGFITAGHCGRAGNAVQTAGGAELGSIAATSFPETDFGWVAMLPGFTGTGTVSQHDGTTVPVRGAAPAAVGDPVCMSGQASGWHCGEVVALDQTVQYDQGLVSGLTATSICSDAGDSGGAFISGNQAQGVVSGGVGDCATNGTTYFQPLGPVLDAYGLSLRVGS